MAITKIQSESLNLADDFAFTGTITGAGGVNTPAFWVTQSVSQSIPNATQTKIQFNSERYDTDNAYDNSTNYRFTVPSGKGGKYFFTYACAFGGFAADQMLYIHLRINGTQQNYNFLKNSTSGDHSVNASSILNLNAGDYVEVFVYHTHGSAIGTDTTSSAQYGAMYFGGYKIIE